MNNNNTIQDKINTIKYTYSYYCPDTLNVYKIFVINYIQIFIIINIILWYNSKFSSYLHFVCNKKKDKNTKNINNYLTNNENNNNIYYVYKKN